MANKCSTKQTIRELESRKRELVKLSFGICGTFFPFFPERCTLSAGLIVSFCLFAPANATLRQTIDDGTEHTRLSVLRTASYTCLTCTPHKSASATIFRPLVGRLRKGQCTCRALLTA